MFGKYGLVDGTFPVAKFARDRIQERYPTSPNGSILPSTEPSAESKKPDLLSKFVQAKYDRPEFMNDSMVMTMAVSMAFAGSETTAISLSSVFYYLLKNPRCMEKVYEELDSKAKEGFFGDYENGLVTWSESQNLPYIDACIKEAFRLHPAPGLTLSELYHHRERRLRDIL